MWTLVSLSISFKAAADEALKAQGVLSLSVGDQQRRTAAIDSINNDQFVQNSFKSNRSEVSQEAHYWMFHIFVHIIQ